MQGSQSQVTFQLDTGAECNLISLKDYRRATGDVDLAQVMRCSHKFIKTYTNERYKILGSTELPTLRHEKRNVLPFNITEDDLVPLLSYSTCIGLGLITINDCDSPSSFSSLKDTPSVGIAVTVGIADLLQEYKDVFEGLGDLPGEYHIVTDNTVPPVVHPPRRVPVALRNQIKEKLDEMVASGILAPVTEPTEWVSSMLVIVKPNELRICASVESSTKCQQWRKSRPAFRKQRSSLSSMPRTAFGRNVYTLSLATRPPLTHRLGATDGIGCRLAFRQRQKSGNVQCTSLLKTWKEWK